MSSPVFDLSYRNALSSKLLSRGPWWAIARQILKVNLKKRGLWVLTAFSGWWYLILIITVYVFEQIAVQGQGNGIHRANAFFQRVQWGDQMLHAMQFGQIFLLFMALMCGAGSIANDNRSNALLVYLSRRCTKADYLFGKWLGIFLSILIAYSVPHLFFLLYGSLTYLDYGFISRDPWVPLRLIAALPIIAAIYASLVVGISSMFNQGRIAGAVLAATYFLSNLFTKAVQVVLMMQMFGHEPDRPSRRQMAQDFAPAQGFVNMFHLSIDGIVNGLAKHVMGFKGTNYSLFQNSGLPAIHAPTLGIWVGLALVVVVGSLGIAWRRIRAVEVVQ